MKFIACLLLLPLCLKAQSPVFTYTDSSFVVGSTLIRRNISFSDACQTKLNSASKKPIDSLYKFLVANPELKIEVGVHAGESCKCETCANPTQNGSDAIKNYLLKKGIDKSRITAMGYGQTVPVSNLKGDGKTQTKNEKINTRVVIKITYNKY